ncbi:pyrroline-5-carboxylate reductase [Thiomicrospira cyclica]|uniref:Pyrroline-5-carboxylate reductase n=1 Tax=Thiomicrospira cyclica (strain DSM 14477 / JCM 11371 / ALM1) TaxID=717773 RepID=F6DAE6_THICA|nr:pyrroline-5-carboxylate reductase [Thiomicrospira cyclica]AEG31112.1 pyrroline-5-carboxylate reductase [Thiomicrospira cyclica ALM1]
MTTRIAFLGAGNMAKSLIGGLLASGHPADAIMVSDKLATQAADLQLAGVCWCESNDALLAADLIVLAVKPQQLQAACEALAPKLQQQTKPPLFVSIAAGITTDTLARWLGADYAIVRTMPNTPALIQSGATGLFANAQVTPAQHEQAEQVLRSAGITLWVNKESQLDAVTALSGSGPAYFFLFMEAMVSAGKELGLNQDTAELLTLQTALGAAKMALESDVNLAELRARVTSPNGTTERAIQSFQTAQLEQTVAKAMQAAHQRAQQLSQELGGQA